MFPVVVRLCALTAAFCSAALAERLYVHASVSSISGPNLEGVLIGDAMTAWFDYELVTTPHAEWDPDNQTLEDAVEQHASQKLAHGLQLYRNGARIGNTASPAYWILHDFHVDTPYGVWENIWQDYAFFDFDGDLGLKGFGIGGSWLTLWVDENAGLSYWSMFSGDMGSTGTYVEGIPTPIGGPVGFAPLSTGGTGVPEPGSFLMVLGGLVTAGAIQRYRRRTR